MEFPFFFSVFVQFRGLFHRSIPVTGLGDSSLFAPFSVGGPGVKFP